jgi:hypothetical protein
VSGVEGDAFPTDEEIIAAEAREARRWSNDPLSPEELARNAVVSAEEAARVEAAAVAAASDRAARFAALNHAKATRKPGHYWVVWEDGDAPRVAHWPGDGYWILGRGSIDHDDFVKVYETPIEPPE